MRNAAFWLVPVLLWIHGCANHRPIEPKSLDADGMAPTPPVVQQLVLEPVVIDVPDVVLPLPAVGVPEVAILQADYARKVRTVGAVLDTTATKTYSALIGPGARVFLRANGTFRVEEGWLLIRVPHGPGALWAHGVWPWVMGARVNGGVDGYTADDHVVIQVDPTSGVTRMFMSSAPAAAPTVGQYRVEGSTAIGQFSMSQYLEFDGDPTHTPSALALPPPAAVESQLARIRSLAKAAGLLP